MPTESVLNNPQMLSYIDTIANRESEAARSLRKTIESLSVPDMSLNPDSAQLLAFLVKLTRAKKLLELGTYYGYSALRLAEALPENGTLMTCDIQSQTLETAKSAWKHAGVDQKITAITQPALTLLDTLKTTSLSTFDCIFIDADKNNYPEYYEACLALTKPSGLIAIDNTLCFGKNQVSDSLHPAARAVDHLNQTLKKDERIDLVTLSIGDGLTLLRKR